MNNINCNFEDLVHEIHEIYNEYTKRVNPLLNTLYKIKNEENGNIKFKISNKRLNYILAQLYIIENYSKKFKYNIRELRKQIKQIQYSKDIEIIKDLEQIEELKEDTIEIEQTKDDNEDTENIEANYVKIGVHVYQKSLALSGYYLYSFFVVYNVNINNKDMLKEQLKQRFKEKLSLTKYIKKLLSFVTNKISKIQQDLLTYNKTIITFEDGETYLELKTID